MGFHQLFCLFVALFLLSTTGARLLSNDEHLNNTILDGPVRNTSGTQKFPQPFQFHRGAASTNDILRNAISFIRSEQVNQVIAEKWRKLSELLGLRPKNGTSNYPTRKNFPTKQNSWDRIGRQSITTQATHVTTERSSLPFSKREKRQALWKKSFGKGKPSKKRNQFGGPSTAKPKPSSASAAAEDEKPLLNNPLKKKSAPKAPPREKKRSQKKKKQLKQPMSEEVTKKPTKEKYRMDKKQLKPPTSEEVTKKPTKKKNEMDKNQLKPPTSEEVTKKPKKETNKMDKKSHSAKRKIQKQGNDKRSWLLPVKLARKEEKKRGPGSAVAGLKKGEDKGKMGLKSNDAVALPNADGASVAVSAGRGASVAVSATRRASKRFKGKKKKRSKRKRNPKKKAPQHKKRTKKTRRKPKQPKGFSLIIGKKGLSRRREPTPTTRKPNWKRKSTTETPKKRKNKPKKKKGSASVSVSAGRGTAAVSAAANRLLFSTYQ